MSATKSMCVECGKDAMTFSPDDGWKCENCGHRLTGKRNYDKPSDVRRKKPMSDTHPGSHVDYTKLDGWDDLSEDEKALFRMLLSDDDMQQLKSEYHGIISKTVREIVALCVMRMMDRMLSAKEAIDKGNLGPDGVAEHFINSEFLEEVSADVGKLFTDGVAKLSDLETRINEAITSKRGDDE
jgi:DNA-directed RNA polymerase subunit RPC12/RpoP